MQHSAIWNIGKEPANGIGTNTWLLSSQTIQEFRSLPVGLEARKAFRELALRGNDRGSIAEGATGKRSPKDF